MAALIFSETSALSPSILWQINVSQRFPEFLAFFLSFENIVVYFSIVGGEVMCQIKAQSDILQLSSFNVIICSFTSWCVDSCLSPKGTIFWNILQIPFFLRFLKTKFKYLKSNMELWLPQTSRYPLVLFVTSLFTITKPPIVL